MMTGVCLLVHWLHFMETYRPQLLLDFYYHELG
jgi:hypothetical protein